jgi:23S rRNA (cytidine1920-2'-O)/16S rRNA (cytidine1409-2'-O)-methyltransferase
VTPRKSSRDASDEGSISRVRIDTLLVDRGLAASRERAQALVMAGVVVVGTASEGERRVDKPGVRVAASASVRVRGEDHPYVSRGGLKLVAALDGFGVDCTGRVALDVGASTGGFTDCLLQRGAIRVLAVDVGYGQFAWKLRQDPRVVLYERQNVRHLRPDRLPVTPELVVIDVSFISLELVLEPLRALCAPGAEVLALVKPQFEVGKGRVGKGGVVRDPGLRAQATRRVGAVATGLGYRVLGELESPVPGPKGNIETFLRLSAPPSTPQPDDGETRSTVQGR